MYHGPSVSRHPLALVVLCACSLVPTACPPLTLSPPHRLSLLHCSWRLLIQHNGKQHMKLQVKSHQMESSALHENHWWQLSTPLKHSTPWRELPEHDIRLVFLQWINGIKWDAGDAPTPASMPPPALPGLAGARRYGEGTGRGHGGHDTNSRAAEEMRVVLVWLERLRKSEIVKFQIPHSLWKRNLSKQLDATSISSQNWHALGSSHWLSKAWSQL